MKSITFGNILENLLYISNQKKSSLARALGYDISYVNKWISSRNMPSSKRINEICENISNFIVKSLTEATQANLIEYFEIDKDSGKEFLRNYIDTILKDAYMDTVNATNKSIQSIPKNTHSEEYYNSTSYVKPTLMEKSLLDEIHSYANNNENLEVLISLNLFDLNHKDKVSLATMKKSFYELSKKSNLKVDFSMGLKGDNSEEILNALLVINLISTYPALKFNLYSCSLNSNTTFFAIKDKFIATTIFSDEGDCLFSTTSKEKRIVEEFYYSLVHKLKTKGKHICDKITPTSMIEDQTYIQYIMNNDLRCLLGSINEFFMPEDLFMEIAYRVFGDNNKIINELKKINVFLHNATYKSKLKVLIYELELRKYLSSGCIHFFNNPVTLTFKERERHIEYIEKILMESDDVEIRLVDGNFIEDFKNNDNPSLYLSKNLKFTKMHPVSGKNYYSIISDPDFRGMCDSLFEKLWNDKKDIVLDNKQEILERISKSISYTKIISENFGENID